MRSCMVVVGDGLLREVAEGGRARQGYELHDGQRRRNKWLAAWVLTGDEEVMEAKSSLVDKTRSSRNVVVILGVKGPSWSLHC